MKEAIYLCPSSVTESGTRIITVRLINNATVGVRYSVDYLEPQMLERYRSFQEFTEEAVKFNYQLIGYGDF